MNDSEIIAWLENNNVEIHFEDRLVVLAYYFNGTDAVIVTQPTIKEAVEKLIRKIGTNGNIN